MTTSAAVSRCTALLAGMLALQQGCAGDVPTPETYTVSKEADLVVPRDTDLICVTANRDGSRLAVLKQGWLAIFDPSKPETPVFKTTFPDITFRFRILPDPPGERLQTGVQWDATMIGDGSVAWMTKRISEAPPATRVDLVDLTVAGDVKGFRLNDTDIRSFAYTPGFDRLVCGTLGGTIRALNAQTGKAEGDEVKVFNSKVCRVVGSEDGSRILACTEDERGEDLVAGQLGVLDCPSLKVLYHGNYRGPKSPFDIDNCKPILCPKGTRVAVVANDASLDVISVADGSKVRDSIPIVRDVKGLGKVSLVDFKFNCDGSSFVTAWSSAGDKYKLLLQSFALDDKNQGNGQGQLVLKGSLKGGIACSRKYPNVAMVTVDNSRRSWLGETTQLSAVFWRTDTHSVLARYEDEDINIVPPWAFGDQFYVFGLNRLHIYRVLQGAVPKATPADPPAEAPQ